MYTYNVVVMSLLKISEEIQEAVRTKKPVVALESTLISRDDINNSRKNQHPNKRQNKNNQFNYEPGFTWPF